MLALPKCYIILKCRELVESVTSDIEKYQLGAAGSKVSQHLQRIWTLCSTLGSFSHFFPFLDMQIYEFLWYQDADWYIEISKTRLYKGCVGRGDNTKTTQ